MTQKHKTKQTETNKNWKEPQCSPRDPCTSVGTHTHRLTIVCPQWNLPATFSQERSHRNVPEQDPDHNSPVPNLRVFCPAVHFCVLELSCPFQSKVYFVLWKAQFLSLFLPPSCPRLALHISMVSRDSNWEIPDSQNPDGRVSLRPLGLPPGRNSTDRKVSYPLDISGCHCDFCLQKQRSGKRAAQLWYTGGTLNMLWHYLPAALRPSHQDPRTESV